MFLSIIIPVYNCEKYIGECLYSCINQDISYTDYEIICVNDGSTDHSLSIMNEIAQKHTECNIKILSIPNSGVSHARNVGIETALGDYIWFVDADDFIGINILSGIRKIKNTGESKKIKILSYCFHDALSETENEKYRKGQLISNYPYKHTQITRTIIERDLIINNGIRFYEDMTFGEDTLFYYEVSRVEADLCDSECLGYFYRFHSESTTGTVSEESVKKYIASCYNAIDHIWNYYCDDNHEMTVKMLEYWICILFKNYAKLPEQYFDRSFKWNKLNIKYCDVKLWWLNNLCSFLEKNRTYSLLSILVQFIEKRKEVQLRIKRDIRSIKGYARHPKRLIYRFAKYGGK